MSERTSQRIGQAARPQTAPTGLMQRKCACGTHTPGGGQCAACSRDSRGNAPAQRSVLSNLLEESVVTCPSCWEPVSLELDLSVPEQEYVEDCQVCCRPMRVRYRAEAGTLAYLEVDREDG